MVKTLRPVFGTDGVRGKFGDDLTLEYCYALGVAIGSTLGNDIDFLIGRDTRFSGPAITSALCRGLKQAGATTIQAGIITTPGIASLALKNKWRACAITASHNPPQDNGIKVFDVGGTKISSKQEKDIEDFLDTFLSSQFIFESSPDDIETRRDLVESYIEELNGNFLDSEKYANIKVIIDCANGAACEIAPSVFQNIGADLISINTESDGLHINDNCGATNPESLVQKVLSENADIGFGFDGDADRLIVVDNNGNIRDGDYILALFAIDLASKNSLNNSKIAITSMSNGGLTKFLREHDIETLETEVGDKYVLEAMLKQNLVLGGEQSGHIIRRDHATWGDGIYNSLLVLQIFAQAKEKYQIDSHQLLDLFSPLAQLHDKVKVNNKSKSISNELIYQAIEEQKSLLGEDSRIIIRPSGTEDVVRITVEGLNENDLKQSIQTLSSVVKKACE